MAQRFEALPVWHLQAAAPTGAGAEDGPAAETRILDLRGLGGPDDGWAELTQTLRQGRDSAALACLIAEPQDNLPTERQIALAVALEACAVIVEAQTPAMIERLCTLLRVEEVVSGRRDGSTGIIVLFGVHPAALFSAASLAAASPRVAALAFDAESLAARLKAPQGSAGVRTATGLVLLAAAAAGVPAHAVLSEVEAAQDLAAQTASATAQGFSGVIRRGRAARPAAAGQD
ncbi:hypothetical protein [Rhizobium halophytocola]|uniref:Citrate lyase beta subunit n=1 Tax=Rhizobium halophytocola TaxID=735519 RepID=A0ABS4DWB2_9HYPH|nr:hypothetical protein [Rhizobium halophytocola]MBP1849981.1 citrate lyase beta subunit [Rhizobium halophytocola]